MERRNLITSSSNPRLKTIRRLRRRGGDAFLVEGFRQVSCALESRARIRQLLLAPELWLGTREAELQHGCTDVLELSARAFESISSHVRPDGVAAVVDRPPTDSAVLRLPAEPLVLVAEGVERPGNLGTIVRSTCAAGADALVVADGRTDLFHPETVRGSVGTLFRLALAESTTAETIAWLRRTTCASSSRLQTPTVLLGRRPRRPRGDRRRQRTPRRRAGVARGGGRDWRASRCRGRPTASTSRSRPASSSSRPRASAYWPIRNPYSPRPNSRTGRASQPVRGLRGRGVCRNRPSPLGRGAAHRGGSFAFHGSRCGNKRPTQTKGANERGVTT